MAATRIELGAQLRAGPDGQGGDALYCDTDSCYAVGRRSRRVGPDLGMWGYEGPMTAWRASAPKTSRYQDRLGMNALKAKGLPEPSSTDWDAFARGVSVRNERGVKGFKSAAKSGGAIFARRVVERAGHSDGQWFGSRRLDKATGRTRPVTTRELLEREAK